MTQNEKPPAGNAGVAVGLARPPKQSILVAQQILREIEAGDYEHDAHLPSEHKMLERYAVARGTLREALRILETLGVIALRPGPRGGPVLLGSSFEAVAVGLSLALFRSHTKLQEVIDARVAIEPVCSKLAATNISKAQLEQLEASLVLQEEVLDDESTFLQQNARFHELIASAAGNQPLFAFVRSLVAIEDGQAAGVRYSRPTREAVLVAHRRIVEAIKRREGDSAESLMRAHLDEFVEFQEKHYPGLADNQIQWQMVVS
jgi:GntR family transcriptional repressor for pyruvate dehydrogenase complex